MARTPKTQGGTLLGRLNRLATGGSAMPSRRVPITGGPAPATQFKPRVTGDPAPTSRRVMTTGGPAQPAKRSAPSVSRPLPPSRTSSPMQTGGRLPAYPTAGARSGVGRLQQFEHQGVRDKRTMK